MKKNKCELLENDIPYLNLPSACFNVRNNPRTTYSIKTV